MIEVKIKEKAVTVMKSVPTISLELSIEQATTLLIILGNVGGGYSTGDAKTNPVRQIGSDIWRNLKSTLVGNIDPMGRKKFVASCMSVVDWSPEVEENFTKAVAIAEDRVLEAAL